MSWIYQQVSGTLYSADGEMVYTGYSGHGDGLNNPAYENVPDVGPIPRGSFVIGTPHDSETHGPVVLPLTPMESTETFGREGFLMHGDEVEHPGQHLASHGCIIMPRTIR